MNSNQIVSDAELIRRYKGGDARAFERLVQRYNRPLTGYLRRMITDRIAADDLFQETFLKVVKALPRYREDGKFSSWLFGIANHVAIDYLRKQKRIKSHMKTDTIEKNDEEPVEYEDVNSPLPDQEFDRSELKTLLKQAVGKLPVEQKQVLLLRQYSGMSFKEIAEKVNCPLNTVLGRMRYALINLKKIMQSEFGDYHVM
ncbi:MAG: sigma-70 family RNA polymerase sigma factor [candidate division KSB1 bacterium]|nr:sigma-70 family RNA polymerase sigma factor [candidate division KSB1 bacterium]